MQDDAELLMKKVLEFYQSFILQIFDPDFFKEVLTFSQGPHLNLGHTCTFKGFELQIGRLIRSSNSLSDV